MSEPPDRSRQSTTMESHATPIRANDEASLPGLSAADAAIYIGDMAASLRRIATGCALTDLAHRLEGVESEARAILGRDGAHRRRGVR